MINGDGEGTDRFLPLKLEQRTQSGRKDLFNETFGFDVDAPFLRDPECYQSADGKA
jgi:hypothetical protein